ncbi:hypothetical protein BJY04DRAFT_216342 [Aspergillus karnatakaensis]|uniref:uncharacterized protein n=1 Tax=Aspergillus karnatakaensis TaxID=1810916 RepID=UPI003CCD9088
MKLFLTPLVAALSLCTGILAAPSKPTSGLVAGVEWTIKDLKRPCDGSDSKCDWSFKVNEGAGDIECKHTVNRSGNTPASQIPKSGESQCKSYTVTSGWNKGGWTTLSVKRKDKDKCLIIWPSYTDNELRGGKVAATKKFQPKRDNYDVRENHVNSEPVG